MIIDTHAHYWDRYDQPIAGVGVGVRWGEGPAWQRPESSMNALWRGAEGVDLVFLLGLCGPEAAVPTAQSTAQLAEYVRRSEGQCLGFAWVDPLRRGAVEQIEEVAAAKLSGVTICPAVQGFHPTHTRAMEMYEACAARKLPVMVQMAGHVGNGAQLELGAPLQFDEAARTFAELKLVFAQAGYPWQDQLLWLMAHRANVFADLSWVSARPVVLQQVLLGAKAHGLLGRFFLGSDFPWTTPRQAMLNVLGVPTFGDGTRAQVLERHELEGIVGRDVLGCLGIGGSQHVGGTDKRGAMESREAAPL